MGLQALAVRDHRGDATQGLGALLADLDQAAALLEVVDAKRAGKTRGAGRGIS
jgi:hypothetical protein